MTLPEFLLARIAEDEAVARGAADDGYGAIDWAGESGPTDVHIARHDPARVLAECEAKRRLVRTMQTALNQAWQDGPTRPVIEYLAQRSLSILALPYADHPDFDESWSV